MERQITNLSTSRSLRELFPTFLREIFLMRLDCGKSEIQLVGTELHVRPSVKMDWIFLLHNLSSLFLRFQPILWSCLGRQKAKVIIISSAKFALRASSFLAEKNEPQLCSYLVTTFTVFVRFMHYRWKIRSVISEWMRVCICLWRGTCEGFDECAWRSVFKKL